MPTSASTLASLRRAFVAADRTNRRSGITPALRSRATEHARARRAAGASQSAIATELDLSQVTVSRWLREDFSATSVLSPVSLVEMPA